MASLAHNKLTGRNIVYYVVCSQQVYCPIWALLNICVRKHTYFRSTYIQYLHYNDVTWASWGIKSRLTQMVAQQIVQVNNKKLKWSSSQATCKREFIMWQVISLRKGQNCRTHLHVMMSPCRSTCVFTVRRSSHIKGNTFRITSLHEGNLPVTSRFPHNRSEVRGFMFFVVICLNKPQRKK